MTIDLRSVRLVVRQSRPDLFARQVRQRIVDGINVTRIDILLEQPDRPHGRSCSDDYLLATLHTLAAGDVLLIPGIVHRLEYLYRLLSHTPGSQPSAH